MIHYFCTNRKILSPWILLYDGSWTKKDLKTIIKLWKYGYIKRNGLAEYKLKQE
jgi:hypothetical protein